MSETADPPDIDVETGPNTDTDHDDDHNHDDEQSAGEEADKEITEIEEIEPSGEELNDDDSLFSGVEDAESSAKSANDAADDHSGTNTGHGHNDAAGAAGSSPQFEQAINQGAARLAVVGLNEDEHDVDALETEFREVFETFRLGYFGAETIDEYVMVDDDEDVDPMWGLAATIAACVAFTLWVRPDGDQQIKRAKDAINSIATGQEVTA